MLKISIAMAVFNGSRYIIKQLNSILRQIRKPDEVIIVDDCSSDETFEIIQSFIIGNNLANWKLFRNKSNLGYIKNFYKAISLCDGDIIFTCDQDDIWCDDKVECIAGLFAKYDKILAVSSSFTVIDENDNTVNKKHKCNYGLINCPLVSILQKISLKTIIHSNISPGCTSAFRRKVADMFIAGSDSKIPHDYELNLIAAALGGLYFYNIPLIKYRMHENNTLGLEGKQQTRIEIATEKLAAAEIVARSNSDYKIYQMYLKRQNAFDNAELFSVIKLLFNPSYRHFLSFKERIGDLIYVMRSKK